MTWISKKDKKNLAKNKTFCTGSYFIVIIIEIILSVSCCKKFCPIIFCKGWNFLSPNYSTPFDNKSVSCHFFPERKISIHHFSASLRSAKSCKKLQRIARGEKTVWPDEATFADWAIFKRHWFCKQGKFGKSPAFFRTFQSQIGKCSANQNF